MLLVVLGAEGVDLVGVRHRPTSMTVRDGQSRPYVFTQSSNAVSMRYLDTKQVDRLAGKPSTADWVHAAALPTAGLTAYQPLVGLAKIGPGARVLIHAAAGGVGHLAVQIAKARGAYVIGTARAVKHDFLRGLGGTGRVAGKMVLTV